jgi:hypothetical protein
MEASSATLVGLSASTLLSKVLKDKNYQKWAKIVRNRKKKYDKNAKNGL